jgi:peptidoglycan/LPS O-acetylase OafA/YrhL
VWLFTLSSLDALALGALLAWLPSVGRTPSSNVLGVAGALGVALVAAQLFLTWELVLFRTGVALAAFAGIGWLVQNQSGRLARMLSFGPLVYIGRISYGIYVYHLFVPSKLGAFARLLIRTGNSWIFATGCFAVTVLVASVSWYFFEAPLNALKERWAAREVAVPARAELQTP